MGLDGVRLAAATSCVLLLLSGCDRGEEGESLPATRRAQGWKLVWQDEFNGGSIDPSKWEHEVDARGGGNNELQYYTDGLQNSRIEGGCLVIQARKEIYTGEEGKREYTSARLRTKGRGDWRYGRIDVRAKLPLGQGIWPAIWMLPTEEVYGGWPASGEIDIVELLGHEPSKVHGVLHYGGEPPDNAQTGASYVLPEGRFSDDFHVFSLEWEPERIHWYVDGIEYQTQTDWWSANGDHPAPFDHRFHLLFNVAVGGDWPGDPDTTTVFPQEMVVDYVRVYQKPQHLP